MTRKRLDKELGIGAKGLKRIMNITREGRRRPASPSWRFEKGKVDINYSKLMSLLKSETYIKNGESFLDISQQFRLLVRIHVYIINFYSDFN